MMLLSLQFQFIKFIANNFHSNYTTAKQLTSVWHLFKKIIKYFKVWSRMNNFCLGLVSSVTLARAFMVYNTPEMWPLLDSPLS